MTRTGRQFPRFGEVGEFRTSGDPDEALLRQLNGGLALGDAQVHEPIRAGSVRLTESSIALSKQLKKDPDACLWLAACLAGKSAASGVRWIE